MLIYAKIINQETKQCDVGSGTNSKFYKSIGMALMEVEQAYNGQWYLKGYAPEKPTEIIQQEFSNAIQTFLDSKAQELNYDSCLSVCSYVDTGVQKFDDESRAFRQWRSAVWNKAYEILDLVKSGEMAIPSQEELISLLPELVIEYTE